MIEGTTFQVSFPFGSIGYTYPTFVTTSGSGVLFSNRCTFLQREREMLAYFGPFSAPFGQFVANLRTFGGFL